MEEKYKQLRKILAEISDLEATGAVLTWDQQVNLPSGGNQARGYQLSTIRRLVHEKSTTDELGGLLDDLEAESRHLDPDSDERRIIKVAKRKYDRDTKIPADFTAEFAKITSDAFEAWHKARSEDNFSIFEPHLENVVDMVREYAEFFAPYDHVYDPLLDRYEPGMKTAEVKSIFEALRPQQVELIEAIADRPQVDDSFLHLEYDKQKQWDFGVEVITQYGYDWDHGRQDKAAHPFTISFSVDDVRITTRVYEDFLPSALFSTLHECGHALYELGISPSLERTTLRDGASLALHESQSRLYENLVGRSLPFWEYFYPRLQGVFPSQLGNVDLQTFYRGINQVEPSLIRVEADEATYNLHVMLRLELEIAIMEGKLEVPDLPEAWNARMEDYLGVVPPSDADGVLQDVHWSNGYFGYFSTYALGNLISVQLWEKLSEDLPDIDDQIRQGQFDELLTWLRKHIHRHGHKFEPQDLVKRVTGSKIDPAPYMNYLETKYRDIYGF